MSFWAFGDETRRYLDGQVFSNSHRTAMRTVRTTAGMTDRLTVLEDYAAGKNVLHIGCCDHVELIRQKVARNVWTHGRISRVANKCIGIDINQDAIDYVANEFNFRNTFALDVTKDTLDCIEESHWDLMLIPDVIEHINNPVDFLYKIRKMYRGKIDQIVITTPNVFWIHTLISLLRNCEVINSDHRYVFTPYTLAKVMMSAGFTIREFTIVSAVSWEETRLKDSIVKKMIYNRFPLLGHTIVMNGAFDTEKVIERPSGLALDEENPRIPLERAV